MTGVTSSRVRALAGVATAAAAVALVTGAGMSRAEERAAPVIPALMNCGSAATVTLRVRNQTRIVWPARVPLTLHATPAARALGIPVVVRRRGSGAVRPFG